MRFGLDVAQQRVPWGEVVSRVQFAEQLGFDGAWGFDHFQPMYGEGPGETFEGMTTLAALTGVTSRIRLGLLVTGVTYRHPSVLASQALTIDHASGGRLELSLGAAWFDKEHMELGIPFPSTSERFDLLEDALEIVTRLFTRRRRVLRRTGRVVAGRAAPPVAGAAARTRRSGSAGAVRGGRSRSSLAMPTSGTRGEAPIRCARRTTGSTSSLPQRDVTRHPSCERARCRSTTSTPRGSTRRSGGTRAMAISSAVGPKPDAPGSRNSPATSCPNSPTEASAAQSVEIRGSLTQTRYVAGPLSRTSPCDCGIATVHRRDGGRRGSDPRA